MLPIKAIVGSRASLFHYILCELVFIAQLYDIKGGQNPILNTANLCHTIVGGFGQPLVSPSMSDTKNKTRRSCNAIGNMSSQNARSRWMDYQDYKM